MVAAAGIRSEPARSIKIRMGKATVIVGLFSLLPARFFCLAAGGTTNPRRFFTVAWMAVVPV
ncbi:hypothetical protein [Noviherbaspirillum malthae]|uniref:hypothetical protein n=1 Tax=Noviherbaspirillum malthae TaxID=1260987 RepID=UPI00188E0A81|nr:hypothetical protein [Noviherbaspirillum malthae]